MLYLSKNKQRATTRYSKDSKRVMIFSGAGLSAESGLKTFRDSDDLWEEFDIMEACSANGFAKDRNR